MSSNNNSNNNNNNSGSNVSIPQLIQQTQGLNNSERNSATQQLKYLEDSHFAQYILELCRILGSSTEITSIRQGAGLLLKNCIGGGRSSVRINHIKKRWFQQDNNIRNKLKTTILNVLGLPDINARNTAVNVISNLVLVETLSEWNNLIPILIEKCLSKNNELMYSSLKCIGQIAESHTTHSYLIKYSPKILECIAHGMSQQNLNVQSESMKCLYHIIELIKPNMQIEKERTIIFQMVCCGSSNGPNKDLRLHSFMCISRLIQSYYHLLKPYMQSIFQITKQSIEKGINMEDNTNNTNNNNQNNNNNDIAEITKQAIEVWSTCAEIEYDIQYEEKHCNDTQQNQQQQQKRQSFGFVNKALELLVPIYLKALKKQKDDIDEDEWTIRKAAACSLELFANVSGDNILKYVLSFVEQNIGLSNWRGREAALCAFGYILDGPSENKLTTLVGQILPIILKLMSDSHIQVRTSAVWTFGRICEIVPHAIGNKNILEPLVTALNDRNNISDKACWSIASLTKYYHDKQILNSCIYSESNAFNLIRELLKRGQRIDCTGSLIIGTHEAINAIIYHIPETDINRKMLESLLPELVNQMMNNMNVNNSDDSKNNDILQYKMSGLFSSVQVLLLKLGQGCLSSDITNKIMHCCCRLLGGDNNLIYEEALGLISAISRCILSNFRVYLETQSIQELLIKSIRIGLKNESICRIGVGCIGDVYTSCTDYISTNPINLQSYSDRIVAELLSILINNDISIELKSHVVDALTDILISHGQYAERYSVDILNKCLEIGCLIPPQNCDQDMIITFNEIRCSITDTIRSCLAELASSKRLNNFKNYIPKINQFFKAICDDINRINDNVLQSVIKLLSEAAEYTDIQTRKQLRNQFTQKILSHAGSKKNINPKLAKDAHTTFQQISQNN